MSLFPFFKFRLLLLHLVLPVGEDVQKLNRSHPEHIIPGATAGLRHGIHIVYPSPLVSKAFSCSTILSRIFLFSFPSGIFSASSLE